MCGPPRDHTQVDYLNIGLMFGKFFFISRVYQRSWIKTEILSEVFYEEMPNKGAVSNFKEFSRGSSCTFNADPSGLRLFYV